MTEVSLAHQDIQRQYSHSAVLAVFESNSAYEFTVIKTAGWFKKRTKERKKLHKRVKVNRVNDITE